MEDANVGNWTSLSYNETFIEKVNDSTNVAVSVAMSNHTENVTKVEKKALIVDIENEGEGDTATEAVEDDNNAATKENGTDK